jgi:hypothetical protein
MIIVPEVKPALKRAKRRSDLCDADYAIFFDIDGCFHPQGAPKWARDGDLLPTSDPLFIWAEAFEEIIKPYHNVPLICHSMWRMITTQGVLYRALPPVMQSRYLDCTSGNDRYGSIQSFAEAFGFKKYIIIDDDASEFPKKLDNFVECNSHTGMSCSTAQASLRHKLLTLFGPPPPPEED